MKLEDILSTVVETLREQKIPVETIKKVEEEIEEIARQEKLERAETPKNKKKGNQFQILVSDPEGKIPAGTELVGWVLQMEESAGLTVALERTKQAAILFNRSRKGQKHPVKTVGETMESVARKFWKTDDPAVKTLVKTKTPVYIQTTDNRL